MTFPGAMQPGSREVSMHLTPDATLGVLCHYGEKTIQTVLDSGSMIRIKYIRVTSPGMSPCTTGLWFCLHTKHSSVSAKKDNKPWSRPASRPPGVPCSQVPHRPEKVKSFHKNQKHAFIFTGMKAYPNMGLKKLSIKPLVFLCSTHRYHTPGLGGFMGEGRKQAEQREESTSMSPVPQLVPCIVGNHGLSAKSLAWT